MFMIYSENSEISQFFESEELAKEKAKKVIQEKNIAVYVLKVVRTLEMGIVDKKVTAKKTKIAETIANTENIIENKQVDEIDKRADKSQDEDKKDTPLFIYTEEVIKEVEQSPEVKITEEDLKIPSEIVPIGSTILKEVVPIGENKAAFIPNTNFDSFLKRNEFKALDTREFVVFQEFVHEIKTVSNIFELDIVVKKEKFKYISNGKYGKNYDEHYQIKRNELLELELLEKIRAVTNLDDIDTILKQYSYEIRTKSSVQKEVRDIEFNLSEQVITPPTEEVSNNIDSNLESIKDSIFTAFDNCSYVEDLNSTKESLKIKYSEYSNEDWFKEIYHERAKKINGKIKKFAESLK